MNAENLRFTRTHEWIAPEGEIAVMGISDFAVRLLTDIVFMELPKPGKKVRQSETIGEIESVKAVSDLYAPVDGEIVEVNSDLPDNLALLTDSPFEKAWIAKIRMTSPEQAAALLNHADYVRHCEADAH